MHILIKLKKPIGFFIFLYFFISLGNCGSPIPNQLVGKLISGATIIASVEKIKSPWDNEIKVFDVERTLCDCIKYIDHLDRDLVLTGLKLYLKSEQKDSIKLMAYAKQLKISDKINQYLEVL